MTENSHKYIYCHWQILEQYITVLFIAAAVVKKSVLVILTVLSDKTAALGGQTFFGCLSS